MTPDVGNERCTGCRFLSPYDKENHVGHIGQCRRHAPQPLLVEACRFEQTVEGWWPGVTATDWCGEFKPR